MNTVVRCALALPFVAATACVASAQEALLEEIRVTASRNLLDQPLPLAANTARINRDEHVSLNRSVADWLEQLPGVTLNGQGGLQQSYSVRGFSRWRIRTEVDGVPILTDRRAGNAASFIPPDLLAEVSVSRGPGSTLYGSDAMGGVVSLGTLQPETPTATMNYQNNDGAVSLSAGTPIAEGSHLAVAVRQAGRATAADGQTIASDYEQRALVLGHASQWSGVDVDIRWLPSSGRHIGKATREGPDGRVSDYPYEDHSILRAEARRGDQWLLRLYHHWADWQSVTHQDSSTASETDYRAHTLGGLAYRATQWFGGVGRIGSEWIGRRGVDIRERTLAADTSANAPIPLVQGQQDNLGLFADQQWSRGPWRLGAGLRYDHIAQDSLSRSVSDRAVNGSIALDWLATADWRISGRWGTGFRFPTLSERFFTGTTPRGDTLGNPALRAERLRGFELNTQWSGATVMLEASLYRNQLRDYIERYRVSPSLRSFRNTTRANIDGAELAIGWQASPQASHRLSYQWQQGEDQQGRWLDDLNPAAWRYRFHWQHGSLSAEADLLWRPYRARAGENELPLEAARIVNGRTRWQFRPHWQAELYGYNLFNARYRGTADEDAPFQPGRTIGVRLVWQG